MDEDLEGLNHGELLAVAKQLRAAIRSHRDQTGHGLCWHHPDLWALLPDPTPSEIAVPPWPKFLRGCVKYRESLDSQRPDAPVWNKEFDE
jgi:hypothetical protein